MNIGLCGLLSIGQESQGHVTLVQQGVTGTVDLSFKHRPMCSDMVVQFQPSVANWPTLATILNVRGPIALMGYAYIQYTLYMT